LDVFGVDPITLRWKRIELTVAMAWYTRCIVGLRLTPVSTKAVDPAAMMFQVYRPQPAPASWPDYVVWPHHGIPRAVCIDLDQLVTTPGEGASGPALTPETIVVDHGKIYVSEHLNSVCQLFGISIQPARIREGRDEGPLERFFRTVREGLLQYLPGYKAPISTHGAWTLKGTRSSTLTNWKLLSASGSPRCITTPSTAACSICIFLRRR
jgi:transposase InsO family protein